MKQSWKKSVFLKKLYRYSFNLLVRPILIATGFKTRYNSTPPILINSFPKSGTHLLTQIVASAPNYIDQGNFLASTPSFTLLERSPASIRRHISRLLPREICSAHLHFSEDAKKAMEENNVCHLFIFRDPRDVCVSEAHYLASMNIFHRLHKHVKKLTDIESQINLVLNGMSTRGPFGFIYPRIDRRFALYEGWINDKNTLAMRYEDLVGDNKLEHIKKIATFLCSKGVISERELLDFSNNALRSIAPEESHTFRRGEINQWKSDFSAQQKQSFSSFGESLIERLNYPPTSEQ